ncbi:hypothetical protein [Sphingomonas sp. VNH70]|uniref:hypothetical protein n=1 Tax=Sphingomonas silueang TaxID=3156617 RepID=UPI0032B3EC3B
MRRLIARGQAIGAARAEAVRDRVAAAARGVPGVSASVAGERVVLAGRGLVRRTLTDPALADMAEWGR